MDDPPRHVRQPFIASVMEIRQFLVIQTQQVQERGVQVVDVDFVLGGAQAHGIGRAIRQAPFDACPGQPETVAPGIVIAPFALFAHRHSPEFAAPDDQRVVEQTAAAQIAQQAGDWFISPAAEIAVVFQDVNVRVPAVRRAGVKLNEPHAPFDHSPREQAARAEFVGLLFAHSIKRQRLAGFASQIDQLGRRRLHPKGQFVGVDPRRQFAVEIAFLQMTGVQLPHEFEGAALLKIGN